MSPSSDDNHWRAQLAEHAKLPFSHARMLPLEVYRSDDVLAAEVQSLFGTDWLCLARTADVPNVGDYVTAEVPTNEGSRSLIVLRASDDTIKVFDNVCVHRGAQLLEGRGTEARITCPYHAWVYRLDGSLAGGPYMSETCEVDGTPFNPDQHALSAVRSEVWEGFVFITQSSDADPLAPRLQGLTDLVGPFKMAGYIPVYEAVDVWKTNWKLLVENFMDAYHIFKVHKDSFGANGDDTRFTTMYPGTESWAHHRVMNPDDPDLCHQSNTTLQGEWRKTIVLGAVFPGFVIQLQPDWLWFLRITPLETDRVRIAWQVAVAPELFAAQTSAEDYVRNVMDLIHQVNSEDHPIVEGIRRSVDRPQFARAPLSYLERNVYDFDRYVAARLSAHSHNEL